MVCSMAIYCSSSTLCANGSLKPDNLIKFNNSSFQSYFSKNEEVVLRSKVGELNLDNNEIIFRGAVEGRFNLNGEVFNISTDSLSGDLLGKSILSKEKVIFEAEGFEIVASNMEINRKAQEGTKIIFWNANLNQIAERLTEIGLEVENIKSSNSNLDNFIVCKIIKSQKHPNADKLKLCDVSLGDSKVIKVVCGAANARKGLVTIYAPPGSIIPKSKLKLKVAKIRGVESYGMLCSESELNISNESQGIIELKNRENDVGKNYFKSKEEKSIDIAITPNRPDCLGVRGIARDLSSAGLGQLKKQPQIKINQKFKNPIKGSC